MSAEQKDLSGITFEGVSLNKELPFEGVDTKEKRYIQNGKELHARTVVSMYSSRKTKRYDASAAFHKQI